MNEPQASEYGPNGQLLDEQIDGFGEQGDGSGQELDGVLIGSS